MTTPYLPFAIDTFFADVSGLTVDEVGAFVLLMGVVWRTGCKPLADNDDLLARFCRVTVNRWRTRIRPMIERLFLVTEDGWRLPALEAQWDYVQRNRERQREKGKQSAAAKALKNNDTGSTVVQPKEKEKEREEDISENQSPTNRGVPSASRQGELTNVIAIVPDVRKASTKRAFRLPEDWTLPRSWGTWALEAGLTEREVRDQADRFKDYWLAKAGKDATKQDWSATWRNWVRRSLENGRTSYGQKHTPETKNGMLAVAISERNRIAAELAGSFAYSEANEHPTFFDASTTIEGTFQ